MKKRDLVRVKEGNKSAGELGIIVEITRGQANVYWYSGKTYWIDLNLIEVLNEAG